MTAAALAFPSPATVKQLRGKIMLNQYKAIISTHCSEYRADTERKVYQEGGAGEIS